VASICLTKDNTDSWSNPLMLNPLSKMNPPDIMIESQTTSKELPCSEELHLKS